MVESVEGYDPARRSACNLTGGDARKVETCAVSLAGPVLTEIIATALKVGECNACMGRIVAAPTAGASGVLPAVLLPIRKKYDFSEEKDGKGPLCLGRLRPGHRHPRLHCRGGGRLQAEIGSASALARRCAGLPAGGHAEQMAAACATALQNLLGLVCDRWPDWWRSPVSSETSSVRSTPSPPQNWPLRGWRTSSPATRSSTPCAPWAT